MDGRRRILQLALSVLCLSAGGCGDSSPSRPGVPIPATMDAIAERISHSLSLQKLNHLATHADALLGVLTPSERAHLGKDYLRLTIKEPMVLHVAVPAESVPFWVNDQKFEPTDLRLKNPDTEWRVFRKPVPAGPIGLGVNGLDRTPAGHYAVFMTPVANQRADIRTLLELHEADSSHWKLTRCEDAASPSFDVYRPFESIPSELQGSALLQAKHERRHVTLLAPGRIWKTHVASTPLPDQITISFGADPTRELVWSWRTRTDVSGSRLRLAPVEAGKTPAAEGSGQPTSSRVLAGESRIVETPYVLNDRAIRRHRVAVSDLEPGKSYRYSLGDGSADGWGPWATVRTAPARPLHTQFLYLGDPQTGLETWGHRLSAARRQYPEASFALIAGDLVDRGNERTNWDHFFLRSAGVFDSLPLMPCAGNHEYLDQGPQLFRMFFDLPKNGPKTSDSDLVYHFEYGDAFFAILDSTMAVSSRQAAMQQAAWLDEALARTRAAWKFVMFHHPVYASKRDRDNRPLQEHWVPIFDKHHVDIVFQGHDHTYIRTYPLRDHRRMSSAGSGTFYVVSVSGDKFYEQEPRPEFQVARTSIPTYQIIDIDADSKRLTYRSMAESGETVDSLAIDKTLDAGSPVRFVDGK